MDTFTKSRSDYTLPLALDKMRANFDFRFPFLDKLFINRTRRVAESSVKLIALFDFYNETLANVIR